MWYEYALEKRFWLLTIIKGTSDDKLLSALSALNLNN